MGVRKNAKFLSAPEKEDFVKACVLMKADIVNPGALVAAQYSKWDQYVAIHWMIQAGIAPGGVSVNFGHGGPGSFSFLSWHRYFLYQFEQDLQSYVPGVMLPYWDWADPAPILTDTFLGLNGNSANNNVIEQGYFAFDKPGAGVNATALPAWWPASLIGWRLPSMFPSNLQGGLRRQTANVSLLPLTSHLQAALSQSDYSSFQLALEAGTRMHNSLHGWLGGGGTGGNPMSPCSTRLNIGHMSCATISPFDPIFYLHHCNIDRLWAMWQMDGHANEYPTPADEPDGAEEHFRDDIMYPWTGGASGYGTSASIASFIPMPDYSAIGAKKNVDTLDFRNAFGYTYDTISIIGVGLDRTGSMNGLTPDPMVSGAADITKWEAAKRGVSAFLQDCETVQDSGAVYVMAGINTFRSLFGNDFTPVFGSPGYGLIKEGTSFSRLTFDSNIASVTAAGGTPLADALSDVQNTLVEPPFTGLPTDEQRYLAMLTDGMLTSGSPMSSIPDGSMTRTAIFGMGFGTGADVDYATIASMVAKGRTLATTQIFHGENAGTIDKFFSNALAAAIGFTSVFDPVVELFAGEHTHLSFTATSADDAFLLTAQGVDYVDNNWSFMLHAPNGQVVYGSQEGHDHSQGCHQCCVMPHITAVRSKGRLSMIIQRGNADKACWVGSWVLMISYKAKAMDGMFMPELGELLFPVSAGPIKGERYSRLLTKPRQRKATRNVISKGLHGLDFRGVGTNRNFEDACNMVVNVYARTNLKINLALNKPVLKKGEEFKLTVNNSVSAGSIRYTGGFARLISPAIDINKIISKAEATKLILAGESSKRYSSKTDIALALAKYEKGKKKAVFIKDQELKLVQHGDSPLHIHHEDTAKPGIYHLGLIVEGKYYPNSKTKNTGHSHHDVAGSHPAETGDFETFTRILNVSFGVE